MPFYVKYSIQRAISERGRNYSALSCVRLRGPKTPDFFFFLLTEFVFLADEKRSRLVDMLEPEDEPAHGRGGSRASRSGRDSGTMLLRGRRSFFDYDDESPLRHTQLDPRVSEEWRGAYAAAQDDTWQPWAEEKKEDKAEVIFCF